MAKKKSDKKRKKAIKKSVNTLDKKIVKASDAVLTVYIETGKKWQKLLKKSITLSEPIQGKQIDMFFDKTEAAIKQVEAGAEKFKDAFGIKQPIGKIVKKKIKKKAVGKLIEASTANLPNIPSSNDVMDAIGDKVVKLRMEIADKIHPKDKKKKKKSKKKKKKNTNKKVKSKASKKNFKKHTPNLVEIVADDLKRIYGIGPKMESLLNEEGIKTFEALKKLPLPTLHNILEKSGKAYTSYKAAQWLLQAALASRGEFKKMEAWVKKNIKK